MKNGKILSNFAKLRAFRAYVPSCPKLLRTYVPTCLKPLRTYLPTCLKLLRDYVPTCLLPSSVTYLRAYVLAWLYIYFSCLRAFVLCIISCLCALIFHVLTCLQPLKTTELTYKQLMWSLMKTNILIYQVL